MPLCGKNGFAAGLLAAVIASKCSSAESRETAAALSCRGLAKEASMVADCGLPSQRIFSEMTDLPENIGVSSTVIVPEGRRAARKK